MGKFNNSVIKTIILYVLELVAIVCLYIFGVIDNVIVPLLVFILAIYIHLQYQFKSKSFDEKMMIDLDQALNHESSNAFKYAKLGLVTYDEKFYITWMSDFFRERGINYVGQKATKWIPEINQIFQSETDELKAEYKGSCYKITRNPNSQMLFVIDVTDQKNLEEKYENEEIVLGLIHFDNYEEATRYEEETVVSIIDSQVKTPVNSWANDFGIIMKRLKRDRYLLVLNQEIYQRVVKDNFSIMDTVREASKDYPIPITLSMAFAYGNENLQELDESLYSLLELAQGRGGDQVAMRKYGEDTKYFGGTSEAQENRNKMRVKVIAKSIRELVEASNKVVIVGHRESDFDCVGASIGLAELIKGFKKEAYIFYEESNLEAQLAKSMKKYFDELDERLNFVSEDKVLNMLDNDTLVFLVDHHDETQTVSPKVLRNARKVAVIDHHRRKGDFSFDPTMVYLEPGASSASELIAELISTQADTATLTASEATIMYTGIFIDTNDFKVRTGSRTFEAVAQLRKYGADPMESFELLKEDFNAFERKAHVLNNCEKYDNGVIIATCDDYIISRALMSQVANELLEIAGVEASFVIGKINDTTCSISARSAGNTNVQVILEKMHGGGHFSQAGLQRDNCTVKELKEELLENLK